MQGVCTCAIGLTDIDLSTQYKDRSVSSFNLWQSVEMTDKETEAVPPKGSSSVDGATGMDWLTPEGLQEMIATSVAKAVKQSLARHESAPVNPDASARTGLSGKSKVIKEVTTSRMRRGRGRSSIRLGRGWPTMGGSPE